MTPEQKKIVQNTWRLVVPVADTAAKLFYNRLFEIDPGTRVMFKQEDLPAQRTKLVQVLAAAVGGLHDLDALVPVVEQLGRRHAGYGVTAAHYDSVGQALLWTLEQGLGSGWTPAAKAAWTEVYGLLSGVMRRAAEQSAAA